jgi:hypothetical protein
MPGMCTQRCIFCLLCAGGSTVTSTTAGWRMPGGRRARALDARARNGGRACGRLASGGGGGFLASVSARSPLCCCSPPATPAAQTRAPAARRSRAWTTSAPCPAAAMAHLHVCCSVRVFVLPTYVCMYVLTTNTEEEEEEEEEVSRA